MELRQIRSFLVLSEELHFGKAARRLFVAQPALSQHIRSLEEELGVDLFARTSRSVALTEAGHAFVPHARQAMQALAEGKEEVASVDAGTAGTVRVAFVSTAAVSLIPQLLSKLRRLHPRIRLQLSEADTAHQVQGLLARDYDIGFIHAAGVHAGLRYTVAEMSEVVVALPAKHPQAKSTRVALKYLAEDTFILPAPMPHRDFYDMALELCQRAGFRPHATQEVSMLQTALPLIAAGAGCALLPATFQRLRPHGVTFRPMAGARLELPIYAVTRDEGTPRLVGNVLRLLED
ncbi:LysR substrate-binding domain-containing protein [Silvibacterium sp.]|uniref:LysR substrate-binding domain-containing protein n=1 Tax=Silvibacterium sp. TaxID=1964179 RepID=UPI0039E6D413